MTAIELITRQTEKQIDSLFRAARALPADKLDWKPAPGARSALDQLQEIATSYDQFQCAHKERKVEWDGEKFAAWMAERAKITDLDELERLTREGYGKMLADLQGTDPANLTAPVQMPFPGDFSLADIFCYYYWNASYHEGQIYYIGTLLASE